MFREANEEIEAFDEQFDLQVNEEEVEGEGKLKKRIYWKDYIAREEAKLEKRAEEAEAERLKMGPRDDDDKGKKEVSAVNPIADF